jgi:hypothetical protein
VQHREAAAALRRAECTALRSVCVECMCVLLGGGSRGRIKVSRVQWEGVAPCRTELLLIVCLPVPCNEKWEHGIGFLHPSTHPMVTPAVAGSLTLSLAMPMG